MERLFQMHEALVRAEYNKKRAVQLYAEAHPNEEILPSRQLIIRLAERLQNTGNLTYARRNAACPATGVENTRIIMNYIQENLRQSVRVMAKETKRDELRISEKNSASQHLETIPEGSTPGTYPEIS